MEIERKFWIKNNPVFEYSKDSIIIQSYINMPDDFYEIRLRKYETILGTGAYWNGIPEYKYYIDFKGPGEIEREEFGTKLTKEQYDKLIPHAKKSLIKKRYYLDKPGVFFDVYNGDLKGLKTLEVEGDREYVDDFTLGKDWDSVDVTYISKFKNRNIVYKKWDDIKDWVVI